jgi:transcriptional regulator with XRE-family HTH domain
MEPGLLTSRAGIKLKQLREERGLTLREVEKRSKRLASQKQNPDFIVSRGWLNNVENGTFTPSFFKLYALGVIFDVHPSSMLSLFGCNVSDFGRDRVMFTPPKTHLADSGQPEDTILVPLRPREDLRLDRTSLLSGLAEIWGEIPIRLIQHLDFQNNLYGRVGISDRTMYPIIRPGSIVQIDQSQNSVLPSQWQNEHDRPIFFVELRGEYLCSWCEMRDGYLSAVPHPLSKCEVRRFAYPREAEIVGRVIGVTMRLDRRRMAASTKTGGEDGDRRSLA